jgi:hypothetical protein
VANATGEGWRWWDFAARFAATCTMGAARFDRACADEQAVAAGIDPTAIDGCMGPAASRDPHPVMEAQAAAQEDREGSGRGRVIMLPTSCVFRCGLT